MRKQKRWQVVVLITLALLAVVGAGVYAATRTNNDSAADQQQAISDVAGQVNDLYYDDAYMFLKEDIKKEAIDNARTAVNQLANSKEKDQLEDRVQDITSRFDALTATNKLFQGLNDKRPLNGATLQEYVLVSQETSEEDISQIRKQYDQELQSADDGFYQTLDYLLTEAEEQVAFFTDLRADIQKIAENDQLDYAGLVEALDDLRKSSASLENPYMKAKVLEIISKADDKLTDQITDRLVKEARESGQSQETIKAIEAEGDNQRKASEQRQRKDNDDSQKFYQTQSPTRQNNQQGQNSTNHRPQRQPNNQKQSSQSSQSQSQQSSQSSAPQTQESASESASTSSSPSQPSQPASDQGASQSSQQTSSAPAESGDSSQESSSQASESSPSESIPENQPTLQPSQESALAPAESSQSAE
ncbi:toxin Cry1Ac domain D-VI-related protein [Aerococcus kribbianus]|uniref:Toxin Cry1Ac domain D-VI-related protein n=1 Tax=Aerococcus kribbianus TaxID=2999064 RepID=A0A9X3FN26_9LACT|nr:MULTISPECIES: toxin Cry1Ac domain D-VI-related protein [unclassified Aerococcus]MCZ0717510.1 toxin Cry1Ac domain D-VI-related protein [Aerococcus sp. YH-aer221]MCZ0725798.1 toxin Cry1Ac domain D-VI-related protein [Aerococcus sp. YH-aer222]